MVASHCPILIDAHQVLTRVDELLCLGQHLCVCVCGVAPESNKKKEKNLPRKKKKKKKKMAARAMKVAVLEGDFVVLCNLNLNPIK